MHHLFGPHPSSHSLTRSKISKGNSLNDVQNLTYVERLKTLKLKSLDRTPSPHCRFNYMPQNYSPSQSHQKTSWMFQQLKICVATLKTPLTRNNTKKHFFTTRVVKAWNSLPDQFVTTSNTNTFKRANSQHDLSKFLVRPTFLWFLIIFTGKKRVPSRCRMAQAGAT